MSAEIVMFILGGIIFVLIFWFSYTLIQRLLKARRKKYLPKRPTKFKCMDGHVVRSKGELIIDNYLYRNNIEHEYEKTIYVHGKSIKYDFYLPVMDAYIEYWGYFGKDYMQRKAEKMGLYKKGKHELISIEDIMMEDIYPHLEKLIKKNSKAKAHTKHCPNCGAELDERFFK